MSDKTLQEQAEEASFRTRFRLEAERQAFIQGYMGGYLWYASLKPKKQAANNALPRAEADAGAVVDAPAAKPAPVDPRRDEDAAPAPVERSADERRDAPAGAGLEPGAWAWVYRYGWTIGADGELYIRRSAIRDLGDNYGVKMYGITEAKLERSVQPTCPGRVHIANNLLAHLFDWQKP